PTFFVFFVALLHKGCAINAFELPRKRAGIRENAHLQHFGCSDSSKRCSAVRKQSETESAARALPVELRVGDYGAHMALRRLQDGARYGRRERSLRPVVGHLRRPKRVLDADSVWILDSRAKLGHVR